MKKLFAILIIISFSFGGIQAQELQEILDTYFKTIGMEELLKHNTMTANGKSVQQGMETNFTIWQKRPNSFRLEVDIQGSTMIQAFDGETGWYTAPWTGSTEPLELAGPQLKAMKIQADFDGMIYNYKEKGYTAELIGTEDMEGTEVYKLKFTDTDNNIYYQFIDSENYVLLKTSDITKVDEAEVTSETYYSNYKELDGMVVPYSIESRINGQTASQVIIEEITFDVEIEDSKFKMTNTNNETE